MAITFLDEEEDIVAAAKPPKVKGGVTFLDEEEPSTKKEVKPEPEVLTTTSGRKITFLDEEPTAPAPTSPQAISVPKTSKLTPEAPSESFLRPLADPLLNIGAGINDVLKGFTDAFGADNAVSQNLAKNSEFYRDLLSAGAKQDQEEIGRIMQEAEGQGVLAEIGAGLKALSVAPIDLVSQGIGSLIPFIATAGVGKAVGLSKAGVAVLQGVQGGVVGGGIVKGEIYSAVKEQLINSGVDEDKAEKAAQEAQAYNGKNLDQIFLGVGLGVAASTTGADSAIRKLIAQKVGKKAAEEVSEQAVQEVLRTGFVRGAAKGAAVEFATEGLQGGQERLAANIAVGREGFDVEPMRGVVAQGTLEGSIGAILGGGVSGISAKVEQMDVRQKVALRDAQKAAEEAKQSNAPASAAAVEEQVNQTIEETPDEKVARLQRKAQEGVDIDLDEEPSVSGLPPQTATTPKRDIPYQRKVGLISDMLKMPSELERKLTQEEKKQTEISIAELTDLNPEDVEFIRGGNSKVFRNKKTGEYIKLITPSKEKLDDINRQINFLRENAPDSAILPNIQPLVLDQEGGGAFLLTQNPAGVEGAEIVGIEGRSATEKKSDNDLLKELFDQNILGGAAQFNGILRIETDSTLKNVGLVVGSDGMVRAYGFDFDGVTKDEFDKSFDSAVEITRNTKPSEGVPLSGFSRAAQDLILSGQTEPVKSKITGQAIAPIVDTEIDEDDVSGLPPEPVTPAAGVAGTTASVPVMITRQMEADLLSRGLTQEQLNAMTPQDANDILAQPVPTPETPVTPAVAPVEPAPVVTEETPPPAPEPPVGAAAPPKPTVTGFTTAQGSTYEVTPEGKTVRTKRSEGRGQGETYEPHPVLFVPNETNLSILSDMQGGMGDYSIRMGYSQGDRFIQVTDTNQIPADVTPQIAIVSRSTKQIIPNGVYDAQRNPEAGFNPVEKLYKTDGTSSTHLGNQITEIRPIAEAAAVETTPVTPTPVTPEVPPAVEPPALAPLRRVAKAEQTEDDVSGLVGQGLVELYKGQPVLTQAGLETLPETERPRLTPEENARFMELAKDPKANRKELQRMVNSAAKAAGFNQKWFHGTAAKAFNVFRDFGRKFIYFTQTRQDAMVWAEYNTEYVEEGYKAGETPIPRVVGAFIKADNIFNRTNEGHLNSVVDLMAKSKDRSLLGQSPKELRDRLLEENYDWYEQVAYKFIQQAGFDGAYIFESQEFDPNDLKSADLGILNPNSIKSAEPVTYNDQGNVIPLSQRFQQGEADIRYNPLGYDITNVVEDIKSGRTDGPLRAVNNVVKEATALRDRVKAEADRRQRPRARGKASILERIARERSSGKISEETAQALTDLVNSIREEAIGDTAISIKGAGAASNFDFGQSLVTFFLTQDQPKVGARVGIHEFWHGLSRFLPKTEAEKMAKDYTQALSGYLKDNPWFLAFVGRYSLTPEQFEEYKLFNPKEAETKLVPVQDSQGNIVKYQIKYDVENYRYIMLDEWIAEKMTDLVESRQAMPNTFMGKLAKIIKEFLAQIQAKLGRDAYQSFYNLVTDPNQKIDLQRMSGVARPFQIYQPQDYNYAEDISDQIRYAMRQREDINREYTPNTDEERKAFEKATSNKVLARSPQLAVAAVRLKNGQITAGEYADLVDSIDPFVPKGADPIPTDEKIKQYIQSDKVGKVGLLDENGNPRLQDGSEYEFRIDINTYNRSTAAGDTVYNITAHESVPETSKRVGEAYAYVGVAKVTNPTFMTRAISGKGSAVEIAVGKGKFPLATVKGNYEPITELPADINDPNVWTEVGYNPVRSSFFVDTRSKQAVVGGTEAIMVGSRVFVKNAQLEARPTGITYGKAYNPLGLDPESTPSFAIDTPEAKTLSNLKASMEKVDSASETKGGKPETQKVSEIAADWMESGGDTRALQDAITENTNLSPANAAKVAKVIAKQYDIQQQLAEAVAPLAEIAPEPEGTPRKSSVTKLIEQSTGVRKPIVKLQVNESAALKKQIQLKAREARETRKSRKEAAEDLAKSITDYVKANPIRGPINSRQAMSITKKALRLDVNNEAAVDRFEMYVEKVIENANYDRDLADARGLVKKAKTLSKSTTTQANVKTVLDLIAAIPPALLDNPFEFNLVVQRYLLGLAPVTAKQYAVMPDADVTGYLQSLEGQIKQGQDNLNRARAQRILDKQASYANEEGIPLDEAISILNSEEFLTQKTISKLNDLTNLLTSMAQESQKDVKSYDDSGATAKQKELISYMKKVGLDSLSNEEKKRYIRFSNNLMANGATFGMEQFQSIALGQEAAIEAAKDKRLADKMSAWITPFFGDKAKETARKIAEKTQSESDTLKNIFGREAVGAIRKLLGLNRLDLQQTKSTKAKSEIADDTGEYYKGLRKKYGDDATGFEAKGYAGVAGYLIQREGDKTQEESIAYRRRLFEQNIVELRKSDLRDDLTEADFKERALSQLTGTSNSEILSQLKTINPASYEQLMWWKDTMLPKWRPFLKEHDENFNNQANNYNNPDHLTISYRFREGQLLPKEIEEAYSRDPIGMRIKQAANSIKRKEHQSLPVSPKSGVIANIDINFGYNQYNALVDQVDRAYVTPAWEQVVAFTNSPEFEPIMGGRANATFVRKMLTDIQVARGRQSMTDDEAQMVAGGVRLARKMATQAVLGGFTQPLRQVGDQLWKLVTTSGRWDLIKKNLLSIGDGAPLMDKFPIGRRGDAQAGTQYASTYSELSRRVEAAVTDRNWAKYRELMNKVGEFWMAPLRLSDVWVAKVSWMTYYEAYLNRQGIRMESWQREAELVETDSVRKDAAAQAEFSVDFYGGASDPTKMASLSKQSNNGWKEFAKLTFLPLNSFALQQKNALISDMRDAFLRTGDRKAAIAGIAGTLGGMAIFHATRVALIGGLVYPAGKAVLMGVFGIDMDEPDEEEKQKQLEDGWRKFKASMYGNIVAGGAGQFIENGMIDAFNRTAYLWQANINPDELLDEDGEIMSFGKYEKDVSPLYRFRSYGGSEYTFGLADVLTEQAERSFVATQQIMDPEEMERYTGNEQAYALFSTGVQWAYFFRLMDTDVTRIAVGLKRDMDKQVEEREKEIKAIRSGR